MEKFQLQDAQGSIHLSAKAKNAKEALQIIKDKLPGYSEKFLGTCFIVRSEKGEKFPYNEVVKMNSEPKSPKAPKKPKANLIDGNL